MSFVRLTMSDFFKGKAYLVGKPVYFQNEREISKLPRTVL